MTLPSESSTAAQGAFSLKPLMFETFVCTLSVMSFTVLIGPVARVLGLAPWQAGSAITVGGIAWVLLARVWGAASDRSGRRRIILCGLSGFVLSYAALCAFIAVALHDPLPVWLSFAGIVLLRGAGGGFYAAVPVTGAALIADHVPPQKRAGAMAGLGAASGIGMVAGPGVVGFFVAYGLALPFYITAVLPFIALVVLWRWLPRTEHHHAAPSDTAMLKIGDARLRRPLAVAFISMFSVTAVQIVVGFFALDRLHLDAAAAARAAGVAMTVAGVALILAQLLVRRLGWSPQRLIQIGCVVSALGFGSILFATTQVALWIGYFVGAAGMGWIFPSVTALAANSVNAHEQGATAGTISAAHGLGMIVGPLTGTLIYAIDPRAPYALIAGLLLTLAALWAVCAPRVSTVVQEH